VAEAAVAAGDVAGIRVAEQELQVLMLCAAKLAAPADAVVIHGVELREHHMLGLCVGNAVITNRLHNMHQRPIYLFKPHIYILTNCCASIMYDLGFTEDGVDAVKNIYCNAYSRPRDGTSLVHPPHDDKEMEKAVRWAIASATQAEMPEHATPTCKIFTLPENKHSAYT
jgi:hypothetical protein